MHSKILILYTHPDPQESVANRALLKAVASLPHVTVHDLYAQYPDFFIDIEYEQQLLADHDVIVCQHPLYMYSAPALLKEWIDRVLSKGYAHGEGQALAGKIWRSVITTGGAEQAFSSEGYNRYSIEEIVRPFELTAKLCQMRWEAPYVVHWARRLTSVELTHCAQHYRDWLSNLTHTQGES